MNLPSRIDTQFLGRFGTLLLLTHHFTGFVPPKKRTYFVIGHATFSPHQATFLRLELLRKLVYNQNHKVTRQHETTSLSAPHTAPTGRVSLWPCSFSPVFFSFLTAHPSLIIICSPPCPVWQVLFRPVIYKFSQSSQKRS